MLDYMHQSHYEVNAVLAKALDVLFILHADHEQNCSSAVMRSIGSAQADRITQWQARRPRCLARSTAAPTKP